MKARSAGSRLALFAIVFALLLKGGIPLFASWSAHLQGKGVAEVCDVYGVTLPGAGGHAMHAMHGAHAMHGMDMSSHGSSDAPAPHDPGRHAGDHCALGALVAFAGGAGGTAALPVATRHDPLRALDWTADPNGVDASALWAALLGHGPPSIS